AESGEVEHLLRDDGAAQKCAEVDAELRDDRCQRGAKAVPEYDAPLAQTLGTGGTDVILTHDVEHGSARESRVCRRGDRGKGEPGQEQVMRPLRRVVGEVDVVAGWE